MRPLVERPRRSDSANCRPARVAPRAGDRRRRCGVGRADDRRRRAADDAGRLFDRARRSADRFAWRPGPAGHERRYPAQLAGFDRRTVRLEQGQVLLRLRDPGRGQDRVFMPATSKLVDVGTVFEVVARRPVKHACWSAKVRWLPIPAARDLKLAPGQRLDTTDGAAVLAGRAGRHRAVGAFERGQLIYVDEPLDTCPRRPPPVDGYRLFGERRYQRAPLQWHLVGCRGQARPPFARAPAGRLHASGRVKAGSWEERSSD